MRRIALINQKGGVGKTTTTVNLGAALAEAGARVLVVDMDPQANLSLHLGVDLTNLRTEETSYGVLVAGTPVAKAIRPTETAGLFVLPSTIDLSGAELELAAAMGRETILRDAFKDWIDNEQGEPFDYVLFDCPPSLGLLAINALTTADEVFLVVQTEFFALQGLSKLVEVVRLVQKRMHPKLHISGIIPSLYDSRLRLAREVLAELRRYFPETVFPLSISQNVKLAEAPSFGQSILQYAPESRGARDYRALAQAVLAQSAKPIDPGQTPSDEVDPESVKELIEVTLEPIRRQEDLATPRNGASPVRP
ncbi:MAG: chromosome partitioning protein [Planctomycetota bacterium]|jgi:chromosome partitioning protein